MELSLALATEMDRDDLSAYFKHYPVKAAVSDRVCCYTSHNFTVIAKLGPLIAGIVQWYVKENPAAGLVEFEEVYVKQEFRRRRIGYLLVEFAIRSVKFYFHKVGIQPRKIYLFLTRENRVARSLYEKLGFVFVSEAGHLFSDTETDLLYALNL